MTGFLVSRRDYSVECIKKRRSTGSYCARRSGIRSAATPLSLRRLGTTMAQPAISEEAEARSKPDPWARRVLVVFALTFVVASLADCGSGSATENGFPNPKPLPVSLTVVPSAATVAPRSTTTFSASPSPPQGFSVVWSVSPATAGTITNAGIFTASQTAASGLVIATWLPSDPSTGKPITGSASVTVLQPSPPSTDMTQASGVVQTSGSIENAAIAGERLGSVVSTDASGNTQLTSGFSVPIPCTGTNCH